MRTTVMLPPDLLRAAKARAAQRGETFKSLLTRALETELGRRGRGRPAPWPLLKTKHKQRKRLTNADIEEIFAAEDVERVMRRS